MTDWKTVAAARGLAADERVVRAVEMLEQQFAALKGQIAHETEPAIFYVLRHSGEGQAR